MTPRTNSYYTALAGAILAALVFGMLVGCDCAVPDVSCPPPVYDALVEEILPNDPAWGKPGFSLWTDGQGTYEISWESQGVYFDFRGTVSAADLEVTTDPVGFPERTPESLPPLESCPTPVNLKHHTFSAQADGMFLFRTSSDPVRLDLFTDGERRTGMVAFASPVAFVGNVNPREIPFWLKPSPEMRTP